MRTASAVSAPTVIADAPPLEDTAAAVYVIPTDPDLQLDLTRCCGISEFPRGAALAAARTPARPPAIPRRDDR
jgi:hypothetical protein